MFETSKDVLFLVIAICVAAFTFFSCWGLFYMIGIVRNAFKVSRDARRIVEKVEGILDALKEKINSSASYLFFIGEALKKILDITKDFRDKKNSKKKDKENEEK